MINTLNMNAFSIFDSQFSSIPYVSSFFFFQISESKVSASEVQPILPPPGFVEHVTPLTAEEVPLNIAKEESLTLMIKGVLAELVAEVEATEAQGNEEEKGSSSTPGKEDNKGVKSSKSNLTMFHHII